MYKNNQMYKNEEIMAGYWLVVTHSVIEQVGTM